MQLRLFFALTIGALFVAAASSRADDFASDLAQCAKAPIVATSFASDELRKAAAFIAEHGECVPMITGGDPLLYGLTPGVAVLQQKGVLGKSAQACFDDSFGKGSRAFAGVLSKFVQWPPLSTAVPSKGQQLLLEIANNQSDAALYQVPGVSALSEHVSCACAVSSSAMDIDALREKIKEVVGSIEGCKNVLGKLASKAYETAKAAYDAGKDTVNALGCTLGLGGCSDGPPYFCTGYFSTRASGLSPLQVLDLFPRIFDIQTWAWKNISDCEPQWQAKIAAAQKAEEDKKAKALLDKEIEKAQQTGSANALGFAFRWSPKCWDDICKKGIAQYADLYNAEINDPDTISHYGTFGAAVYGLEKKYGGLATVAITLSKDRRDKALRNNASAPVADRLDAFGCTSFLGRPKQSLCKNQAGFAVCADYVRAGSWNACALAGKPGVFSAGAALEHLLRSSGCIPGDQRARSTFRALRATSVSAQCIGQRALAACVNFKTGQSAVTCEGAQPLSFDVRRMPKRLTPVSAPPPSEVTPSVPPQRRLPGLRPQQPARPASPQVSTICAFDKGPRAGERQDYAPMAPLPVGTPCHDGRGSTGSVVAN